MTRFRRFCHALVLPVVILFAAAVGPLPAAQAAMVSTDEVIADSAAASDRAAVESFLAREDVRQEMRDLGVDPAEADARVAAMSDAEVSQLAGKLEEAKAGQNAIGAIVGAAVFVFVVLLVTDLLCLTSVFDFTRCAR
jgi:hypothetical protein